MIASATGPTIPQAHVRRGLWLLVPAGLIPLLIFTLWMATPYPDTDQRQLAELATGPLGLGANFAYIAALIALLFGLQSLYVWLAGGDTGGWALAGLVCGVASGALLVAAIAAGGLGGAVVADLYLGGSTGVGEALSSFSGGSFGRPILTTFIAAIVLALLAALANSVAIWRSGTLPRWTAIPFGLGFLLLAASVPFATQLGGLLLAVAGAGMAHALGQGAHAPRATVAQEYPGLTRNR